MPRLFTVASVLIAVSILIAIWSRLSYTELVLGNRPVLDLDNYHLTAQEVLAGEHPYELSHMETLGPPSVLIPYLLTSQLSERLNRVFWTTANLLGLIVTVVLFAKTLAKKNLLLATSLLLIVSLISFPVRFSLEMGQPNLVIAGLISLVLFKKKFSGFSLAVIVLFKTFFVVSLASLVTRKKVLLSTLIFGSIMFLGTFWVIKPEFYYDFITNNLATTLAQENIQAGSLNYYNQSIVAAVARMIGSSETGSLSILFLGLGLLLCHYSKSLKIGFVSSVLVSPILWQHYIAALLPIYFLTGKYVYQSKNWSLISIFLLSITLLWVEFPWLHLHKNGVFPALLASHFLVGLFMQLWLVAKMERGSNLISDAKLTN
ncbi:MAG: glycosyltransferase family 87 protein [bacterium]|nr:glycosyltransferase family 87 protein [bacterium]